jgi:cysteine synthase A
MTAIVKRLDGIETLIGKTPLLEIDFLFNGEARKIFAKSENLNMTGSIKDRMAHYIIKKAYADGSLKPGDTIIEATSGNTGIAFAAIGRALGHPVVIYMPDWMSKERINLIKSLGADIRLVSKEEGGFLGSISLSEELAAKTENAFLPCQFSNNSNAEAHYFGTGLEIHQQLSDLSMKADAFIAGVGTGGTIMGAGQYLREQTPNIKLHPLEPSNSPTLSTGHKVGKHRIQGISDEFIPSIMDLGAIDPVVSVDDGDSIIMAQKLAAELGLGVGISSGANFLGAAKIQEAMGGDATLVTVFADSNKKYLSTDLCGTEPIKSGFLSTDIELLFVRAHPYSAQSCKTCGEVLISTAS